VSENAKMRMRKSLPMAAVEMRLRVAGGRKESRRKPDCRKGNKIGNVPKVAAKIGKVEQFIPECHLDAIFACLNQQ